MSVQWDKKNRGAIPGTKKSFKIARDIYDSGKKYAMEYRDKKTGYNNVYFCDSINECKDLTRKILRIEHEEEEERKDELC